MKAVHQINSEDDIFLQMHRLFKRLQQRNRFVDVEPKSALTLAEAHLLKETITQPQLTQAGYQKLFHLPQSHVSRLIDKLVQRGFLTKTIDKNDSRAVRIKLTAEGQAAVDLSDKITLESFETIGKLLSNKEKIELTNFFKQIADGYGHPEAKLRTGELEYSLHQRRITRCFRLLGKRVFDSKFNSTQWQVLSALSESSVPLAASTISERISLTNGATTAVLKDLLKNKLIFVVTNRLDKRAVNVSITNIGRQEVLKVEHKAANELRSALRDHSSKQIGQWLALLKKYVVDSDDTLAVKSIRAAIKVYSTEEEKNDARSRIITSLVQQQNQQYCPSILASKENLVVGFVRESKVVALFDMQSDGKSVEITAGFFDEELRSAQCEQIVDALRKYLKEQKTNQKIICHFTPLKSIFTHSDI